MIRAFLDTNVVIDLLAKREPFYKEAVKIFTLAYNQKILLFISPLTYANAAYILGKNGAEQVRLLLRNLRQLSLITEYDETVVDRSLSSNFKDFEDALQYYSALTKNVDVIITRNLKDFVDVTCPVLSPDEFLSRYYEQFD